MRVVICILCAIVFFIVGVFMLMPWPNNIFFWFLSSLANYFIIAHLFYAAIFFVIARSYLLCVHEGAQVDDVNEFVLTEEGYKDSAIGATIGFAVFMFVSTIPGYKLSWDFVLGCHSLSESCRSEGVRAVGFSSALMYQLSGMAALLYMIVLPFFMAAFGVAIGMTLPAFVAGVIAFSHRHPAEGFMARSLEQFRADPRAERELLRIMDEQDASDEEVERLLGRLAPWERWYKRIEYRKRARDVRRLREMAELKRRALEEETGLAKSVHELERARRRADDRR